MMPGESGFAIPSSATFAEASPSILVVSKDGDVLIQITDSTTSSDHYYRCSRNLLRSASEYFKVLLDPVKFSEGIAIESRLQDLQRQYNDFASIPASQLPKAVVADVGDLPKGCASTAMVVALFFQILHDPSKTWPVLRAESVKIIALLSIVADRFACLEAIAEYLIRQRLRTALLKDRKSATPHKRELKNRQKSLAGLYFQFSDWVYQCSTALIVEGPTRQPTICSDGSDDGDQEGEDALWWRLPGRVEGALLNSLLR